MAYMSQSSGSLHASHVGQAPDNRYQFDYNTYGNIENEDNKAPSGGHVLVPNRGTTSSTNKPCVYCKLRGKKTTTGLPIKSYLKCNACNLPMCRPRQRDCFVQYHQLLMNINQENQPETSTEKGAKSDLTD